MTARIVVRPYDPAWPAEFREVQALLREALGDVAVSVDHIGSTSVPGLAAKDVVDVQVTVEDLDDPRLSSAMERLGATPTDIRADHVPAGAPDEPEEWEKRYFRAPPAWRPTHLHVRARGRANQRYALLFRDHLRHSASAAGSYAAIKTALARLHPDDADAYYDVKDPVCDLVVEAAERWAAATGWTP
ncbi:GrpB family protein [uncultured Nocardioides sp.]|uniref:GrpB family protein n=1 Tax=uncultured Nocardioides sp. TaxID=198441 RepID=UPI0025CD2382|nr:GrpB family protein [uncultured Nocardioides sp.]